jgi:hypothetical protein
MIKLYIHAFFAGLILNTQVVQGAQVTHGTKSGIKTWVDPATPEDRQTYTSSRGETWELVMSDEFNEPDRDFRPGKDHMWTSIEKPDGVNAALEIYSHDMTSTACDDKGTCYFYIKTIDEVNTVKVYNQYKIPPGYEKAKFVSTPNQTRIQDTDSVMHHCGLLSNLFCLFVVLPRWNGSIME